MNKTDIYIVITLLMSITWAISCAPGENKSTEKTDSSFQDEVQDAATSDQWSEVFIKTYDSLKLESLSKEQEAQYWQIFSKILLEEKIPEEAEKGVLQSLRNDIDYKEADSLIYSLANNLNRHTNRDLIAKTYYKIIADNYKNSALLDKAINNLPADMKPLNKQINDAETIIRKKIEEEEDIPIRLIKDYIALAQLHGIYYHSDESPQYLLKAAGLARGHGNNNTAGVLYDIVMEDFSSLPESPKAMFQKAFMLDQGNKNDEAALYYKRFMERYPDNKLVPQVKILLEEVNLTNEELLERLDKNKND